MGFDVKRFMSAKFEDRLGEVKAPQLRTFFGEGEEPVFKVRGLTGEEIAHVRKAMKTAVDQEELVRQLMSQNARSKAGAIMEELGLAGDSVPEEYVRHIELIRRGSVDPDLMNDRDVIVKIGREGATTFWALGDKILSLTGLGRLVLGESNASGATQESNSSSPCAPEATAGPGGSSTKPDPTSSPTVS